MIFVENNSLIPQLNHAIELYLMDHYDEDIFMFWRNRPSILIGRYQNIHLEVDLDYTDANGMDVVRRLSGGGAIYCDTNNMQYTFITKKSNDREDVENSFKRFAGPVVESLRSLGLNAEFTGRNDIQIDQAKVSGNAQYQRNGKILHHGTLLFKADLKNLSGALKARDIKFKGREVQSVRSRIGFISDHLDMNVLDFMHHIETFIKKKYGITHTHRLSTAEMIEVEKIKDEIFASSAWNYGIASLHQLRNAEKYSCGIVELALSLKDEHIDDITIEGDFFSEKGVDELCMLLKGLPAKRSDILQALAPVDIRPYIRGMDKEALVDDIIKLCHTPQLHT